MNCLLTNAPMMAQARPVRPAARRTAAVRCSQQGSTESAVTRRQAFAVVSATAMGLLASPAHAAFAPTNNDEMMRRKEERMRLLRESAAKQRAAATPARPASQDEEAPSA